LSGGVHRQRTACLGRLTGFLGLRLTAREDGRLHRPVRGFYIVDSDLFCVYIVVRLHRRRRRVFPRQHRPVSATDPRQCRHPTAFDRFLIARWRGTRLPVFFQSSRGATQHGCYSSTRTIWSNSTSHERVAQQSCSPLPAGSIFVRTRRTTSWQDRHVIKSYDESERCDRIGVV